MVSRRPRPNGYSLERGKIDAVVMKARRLIEASTFQPETLAVLFKAFDDAWTEIEPHFAGDEAAIEQARLRLAHAVLIVAREDDDDPEQVKNDALQVMALPLGAGPDGLLPRIAFHR